MNKKILTLLIFLLCFAIFLAKVFSGHIILLPTINFGLFSIRYYGIFIALAAAGALLLALKRAPKFQIDYKAAENIFLFVLVGGFLGARVYHVISAYQYYLQNPSQIIQVWNGGLAIYGAMAGGIIGLWVYNRLFSFHFSLFTLLDWLTPSLLLGQIIGRFGNLFNYELYGFPTNLPWKMFVPRVFRNPNFLDSSFFHPIFFYESLGCVLILLLLTKFSKNQFFKTPGKLFFSYFFLYNVLRFLLEFLRLDTTIWAGFRINFAISLVLIVVSALYIVFKNEPKTT